MSDSIRQHVAGVKNCAICHGEGQIVVPPLDLPRRKIPSRILLLGEQPDRTAALARRRSGLWKDQDLALLRKYVEHTGLAHGEFLYATAVFCVPRNPERRGPRPSTDEARNCGRHVRGLVHALQPQLIVTLGHTPLLTLQHTYREWTELRQYILNYDVGTVLDGRDFSVYPLYFPTESTLKARGERRQLSDWLRIPDILEAKRKAAVS